MRKWLRIIGLIAVVLVARRLLRGGDKARDPIRQRISETVSILAWVLITVYVAAFIYWLVTSII